jgi:hypothetical protein
MSTQTTVRDYFDALHRQTGWDAFLAEGMVFTSRTHPVRQIAGKAAYLQATQRFYSTMYPK